MTMNTSVEPNAPAHCVECGGTFAMDDMIRHGGVYVCINCKPRFMQKLAEGAEIRSERRYAGFWIRFAALFIDSMLLAVFTFALQMIAFFVMSQNLQEPSALFLLMSYGLSLTVGISYEGILVGKYGATVGKMACRIKVIAADGSPVSYPRAFGRYLAKVLSSLTLLIGFIIAAFDKEKRSLHDLICNTRVIYQ